MDDKGYIFTPLTFLLFIPVIVLALSYSGIVNEVNSLSAIVIGGDVTETVASNLVEDIQIDTQDAGRNSAFNATRTVIDGFSLYNNPFFGSSTIPTDSRSFIKGNTLNIINTNITNTCRVLENQTGRTITINGNIIDPNSNDPVNIYGASDIGLVQSDPWGFNITLKPVPVQINQTSANNNQSSTFFTPSLNVYISVEQLEDPYIWVNTKGRNSSVIFKYPYTTSSFNILGGNNNDLHFADSRTAGNMSYMWQCLVGTNPSTFGYLPYYFPDIYGLSFFDRLDNKTSTTEDPNSRMSTFILWNPNEEDVGKTTSMIDHEYFAGLPGHSIMSLGTTVKTPIGTTLLISSNATYNSYLGLQYTY